MADDELHVTIEKAYWPKTVIRGLAPVLRQLGDKHGNIVLAALPAKGVIMVKGPQDRIEAVKPALLEVIRDYFPDAPVPPELGGGQQGGHEEQWQEEQWQEEQWQDDGGQWQEGEGGYQDQEQYAPEPQAAAAAAPAAPAAAAKPAAAAPSKKKAAAKRAVEAHVAPSGPPVTFRQRPKAPAMASPDLLWECMRTSSSFMRKQQIPGMKPFSAEPRNLMGYHSRKFSGLANNEVLDVRSVKRGEKEAIELVQSHAQASRQQRPAEVEVITGLHKNPAKGLHRLGREVLSKHYRPSLYGLAKLKYLRIKQSFKTKKRVVKSRRAPKSK